MSKKWTRFLIVCLVLSLIGNVFLFKERIDLKSNISSLENSRDQWKSNYVSAEKKYTSANSEVVKLQTELFSLTERNNDLNELVSKLILDDLANQYTGSTTNFNTNGYTVYITPSGSKYHRSYCSYIRGNSTAIDVYAARRNGYEPCSRCNP